MRNLFFLVLILSSVVSAQTKFEKEVRVKEEIIPENAVEIIRNTVKPKAKVKWYYQEDAEKKVYEAKFIQSGKLFSVEFLTTGKIYNVEITVRKNALPKKVFKNIKTETGNVFEDFKILKIQTEYQGDQKPLENIIKNNLVHQDLKRRYEIEVNAKVKNHRELYEMIFNESGKLEYKRKIKLKSTDILDY